MYADEGKPAYHSPAPYWCEEDDDYEDPKKDTVYTEWLEVNEPSSEYIAGICINKIRCKMESTEDALEEMYPYINHLNHKQIVDILKYLVASKHDDSGCIIELCEHVLDDELKKTTEWKDLINYHVSKYWIVHYKDTKEYDLCTDVLSLLHKGTQVNQLDETPELIARLYTQSYHISYILCLVNSINYKFSTLYKFISEHPEMIWVINHKHAKSKFLDELKSLK